MTKGNKGSGTLVFRVPAMVISRYAKPHSIDHPILSFDANLKFIEDDFMGGPRIDLQTDGWPDTRPMVRENAKILGNLENYSDVDQAPLKPLILSTHPKTDLVEPSQEQLKRKDLN